jgi:NAD(P)-dependent dehydrogenase (short-subunit alcohol dehydrogenase family)
MPLHDFTSKVVLISGIGCIGEGWGNGTKLATLFARQGALIFGFNINLDTAERAASQIRAESPSRNVTVMHGDATSSKNVKDFVNACIAKHGRINILVNNVGRLVALRK